MLRKLVRAAVLAAGLFAGLGAVSAANRADAPTIDEIMTEAHNKKKGLEPKLKAALKDSKWDDAKKAADRMKELGEALAKTKADKGSADSWKKLSGEYKTMTADIAEQVKKKDAKATEAALAKLNKACDVCHEVHRD
jgi:hypothetical protein